MIWVVLSCDNDHNDGWCDNRVIVMGGIDNDHGWYCGYCHV